MLELNRELGTCLVVVTTTRVWRAHGPHSQTRGWSAEERMRRGQLCFPARPTCSRQRARVPQ